MLDGQDRSLAWTCGTLIVKYIKLSNSCKERKKRFVNVEKFHPILWDIALESRLAICGWLMLWKTCSSCTIIRSSLERFTLKMDSFGSKKFKQRSMVSYGYPRFSFFFFFGMKENWRRNFVSMEGVSKYGKQLFQWCKGKHMQCRNWKEFQSEINLIWSC